VNELGKIFGDLRKGAISFRQLLPLFVVVIVRKLHGRLALSHEECGPAKVV
jgi:hypothetical protein